MTTRKFKHVADEPTGDAQTRLAVRDALLVLLGFLLACLADLFSNR